MRKNLLVVALALILVACAPRGSARSTPLLAANSPKRVERPRARSAGVIEHPAVRVGDDAQRLEQLTRPVDDLALEFGVETLDVVLTPLQLHDSLPEFTIERFPGGQNLGVAK